MKIGDVLCTNWNLLTNYLLPAFNFVHRGATSFFLRKFPMREFFPYGREDIPDIIGKCGLKRKKAISRWTFSSVHSEMRIFVQDQGMRKK
jgi:hypothetical protein